MSVLMEKAPATLALRPVIRDHVDALVKLEVGARQPGLVAENVKTLAQAAYEPNSTVWGLWSGETGGGPMAMFEIIRRCKDSDRLKLKLL